MARDESAMAGRHAEAWQPAPIDSSSPVGRRKRTEPTRCGARNRGINSTNDPRGAPDAAGRNEARAARRVVRGRPTAAPPAGARAGDGRSSQQTVPDTLAGRGGGRSPAPVRLESSCRARPSWAKAFQPLLPAPDSGRSGKRRSWTARGCKVVRCSGGWGHRGAFRRLPQLCAREAADLVRERTRVNNDKGVRRP